MKRFLLFFVPVLALFVLLSTSSVFAASTTSNITVQANVVANCTISAGSISFGDYDPAGTNATNNLDAQGQFTVRCTRGTAARIDLGLGSNASGSTRRMANAGEYLTYELYRDSTRSAVWGILANGLNPYAPSATAPNAGNQTVTVYGRVPAGQEGMSSGIYQDTVVAEINF